MFCCNDQKQRCQKRKKLNGKPENRTPARINKCPGNVIAHLCAPRKEGRQMPNERAGESLEGGQKPDARNAGVGIWLRFMKEVENVG